MKMLGLVAVCAVALLCSGCLSSAPIVPVTPQNQAQITQCENTATLHNAFVIGDFSLTGAGGVLGAVGALEPSSNPQAKTDLAIAAASAGGLAVVATSIAALSNSNFVDQQCSSVVGPLPTAGAKGGGGK